MQLRNAGESFACFRKFNWYNISEKGFFKIVLKNYFFLHTNPTYVPFRVNVFQHARGIKLRELNDENKLTWPPSETNPKDADFSRK